MARPFTHSTPIQTSTAPTSTSMRKSPRRKSRSLMIRCRCVSSTQDSTSATVLIYIRAICIRSVTVDRYPTPLPIWHRRRDIRGRKNSNMSQAGSTSSTHNVYSMARWRNIDSQQLLEVSAASSMWTRTVIGCPICKTTTLWPWFPIHISIWSTVSVWARSTSI